MPATKLSEEKAKIIQRALKQIKYRGASEVLRAILKYVGKSHAKVDLKLINMFIELCDDRAANP